MKNIIINTQNEQLSDAEIEQFKNFDQLLDQYQQSTPAKKGRLSTPKIIIMVSVAGLTAATLCLLLLTGNDGQTPALPADSLTQRTAFIQPPIPQADIPMQTFELNNSRDTTLRLPSGTEVHVPARALLLNGKPAECAKLQMSVREMKTVDEVFLSGIPMQYDSAGTQYTFETAGMMQIEARCDGRALSIDPQRPLTIAMTSPSADTKFNLYQLDTNQRAWAYKGKDRVETKPTAAIERPSAETARLANLKKQLDKIAAELKALRNAEPRAPELANTAEWSIKLDVLPAEFPELRSFKEQLFEIDSRFKPLKKTDQAKNWEDVRLEQSAYPGRYWIKFNAFKDSCRYLVKPVFPKALFAKAKVVFDSSFKAYKKQLAARLKTEDSLNVAIAKEQKRVSDSSFSAYNKIKTKIDIEYAKNAKTIACIRRCFPITQFGIWNCDLPIQNRGVVLRADFMYNDSIYKPNIRYINNVDQNIIIELTQLNGIGYSPSQKTVAWIVSRNEIYYITADEFKQQITAQARPVLHLQKASKPIITAADFKDVYQNEILK